MSKSHTSAPISLIVDSRERWPHPWACWAPAGVMITRGDLEAGRFAVAGEESGAVVDRKTVGELLFAIGPGREVFERELRVSRYSAGFFSMVVEGTLTQLLSHSPRTCPQSVIGTVSAWSRRYGPILFCDSSENAAAIAWRLLLQPVAEANRTVSRARRAGVLNQQPLK